MKKCNLQIKDCHFILKSTHPVFTYELIGDQDDATLIHANP